jgi:hypothetical protein
MNVFSMNRCDIEQYMAIGLRELSKISPVCFGSLMIYASIHGHNSFNDGHCFQGNKDQNRFCGGAVFFTVSSWSSIV